MWEHFGPVTTAVTTTRNAMTRSRKPRHQRFTYWVESDDRPSIALFKAWWGKKPKLTQINLSSSLKDDDMDDSLSNLETVNIDHGLDARPLGEILLREEYSIALNLINSRVEKYATEKTPSCGIVITGQPGIGQ